MKLLQPHRSAQLRRMAYFHPCWGELLQNPLWYVSTVSCLAGLTYYIHFWGWLTGMVALVWGIGLVWHIFKDETLVAGEEQLQEWLDHALRYKAQINQALKLTPNKSMSLYGPSLAAQVNAWTEVIQDLVQRLALLRRDDLIRQELVTVPKAIALLETQLACTTNVTIRTQLEEALASRRNQLVLLKGLQSRMTQAEIQIENTLSLLSTIYSQILTGQSIRHVADHKRLLTGLDEEVQWLQDQLEALREVKEINFNEADLAGYLL